MAAPTMSTFNATQRRRRPATYGKAARSSFYELHDETASIIPRSTSEIASRPADPQKPAGKSSAGAATRKVPPTKKASQSASLADFDVPSSDEDSGAASARQSRRAKTSKVLSAQKPPAGKKIVAAGGTRRTPPEPVAADLQVFDVPLSDDDTTTPKRAPRRPTRSPLARTRTEVKVQTATAPEPVQEKSPGDDSASRKRKRTTPQLRSKDDRRVTARVTTGVGAIQGANAGGGRTLRSAGSTRQATPVSAVNEVPAQTPLAVRDATASRRPIRGQTRTSPPVPRMAEGKSAPAILREMLPVVGAGPEVVPRSSSPLSLPPSTPPKTTVAAEEMRFSTPQSHGSNRPALARSASHTPRQKAAWDTLFADAGVFSSSPSASMKELQIYGSGAKRRRTLSKSVSDLPHTNHTRRQRLIDSLVPAGAVKEAHYEDEESEILEGASIDDSSVTVLDSTQRVPVSGDASQDAMDLDSQATVTTSQRTTIADVGPRRTYASQRSYLEEKNTEVDFLLGLPLDSPVNARQPIGNGAFSMPQRQPQFVEGDQEDSQGGIKSIHELRAAGGNKRFLDDIENLLEDIEAKGPSTLSRKRSGMIELCSKLADESFAKKLFNMSLEQRLFPSSCSESDTILKFARAVAIAFIVHANAPVTWVRQIYRSGALATLTTLLDFDVDISRIAKDRKTNMSKVAQSSLLEFRTLVQQAAFWGEEKPFVLSPRLMGLRSMDLLVNRLRKIGEDDKLLTPDLTSQLLDIATSASGALAHDSIAPYDVACLELALSILESGSTMQGHAMTHSAFSADHLTQLAAILPLLLNHDDNHLVDHSTSLAIRLATNLANNSPRICSQFAEPTIIHPLVSSIVKTFHALDSFTQQPSLQHHHRQHHQDDDEAAHLSTIDNLVLLLGCAINLFEHSAPCRLLLLSSPTSTPTTTATSSAGNLLATLTSLFLSHRTRTWHAADSVQASRSNIPYGYLAVLLGNLCQSPEIKAEVEKEIERRAPGEGIGVLVAAIEEFIRYHRAVDEELGGETWAVFTGRLVGVVERLRGGGGI